MIDKSSEKQYRHPQSKATVRLISRNSGWDVFESITGSTINWPDYKDACTDFDRSVVEINAYYRDLYVVPAEPTITLTQSQVVAAFRWVDNGNTYHGEAWLVRSYIEDKARKFLQSLGAPEDWAGVLVDAVKGGNSGIS